MDNNNKPTAQDFVDMVKALRRKQPEHNKDAQFAALAIDDEDGQWKDITQTKQFRELLNKTPGIIKQIESNRNK